MATDPSQMLGGEIKNTIRGDTRPHLSLIIGSKPETPLSQESFFDIEHRLQQEQQALVVPVCNLMQQISLTSPEYILPLFEVMTDYLSPLVREIAAENIHLAVVAQKAAGLGLCRRLLIDDDPDVVSALLTSLQCHNLQEIEPEIEPEINYAEHDSGNDDAHLLRQELIRNWTS